jgi:hypothetical protein
MEQIGLLCKEIIKNINMKQLLPLSLFLLPCLALAQYPSNGNQKITLGEQTTADGLIFRGVLADTGIITPLSDTSAYIILDTVNHRFYNYNRATNVWSVTTIGSISSGLTGVLPLGNGGTGSATQNFVDLTNTQTVAGIKTFTNNGRFSANLNVNNYLDIGLSTQSINSYVRVRDGSVITKLQSVNSVSGGLMGTESNHPFFFITNNTPFLYITNVGKLGLGAEFPTALFEIKAGTAAQYTAPLKFTSGVNLTTPENGAMEFNGTNLFFTIVTTRHTVNHGLTGSATLDFPSTTTLLSADLTITVTGAADGDVVSLGVPNAAVNANTSYSAWVSAANTVTVRFNNYSSGTVNPASGSFKVFVTK